VDLILVADYQYFTSILKNRILSVDEDMAMFLNHYGPTKTKTPKKIWLRFLCRKCGIGMTDS